MHLFHHYDFESVTFKRIHDVLKTQQDVLICHFKLLTYWNIIPKDNYFQHRVVLVRVDGAGIEQRGADRTVHPLCELPGQWPHPFICEFPVQDVPKQLPRNGWEITKNADKR